MPFTPYHFGPSALLALPFKKYIDIPTFILANVAVDFEPLAVIVFGLDYPLHGFFHTFLIGSIVGIFWGLLAYFIKPIFKWPMKFLLLPYPPTITKTILSGILGVWFHVFLDSFLYRDICPFWPIAFNPFLRVLRPSSLYLICEISLLAALIIFPARAISLYRKQKSKTTADQTTQTE